MTRLSYEDAIQLCIDKINDLFKLINDLDDRLSKLEEPNKQ